MPTKLTGPRKKTKTRAITIRIPEDILEDVEKLASENNQTISNLVREHLIQLIRWDVHESKLGLIQVPIKILNSLIQDKSNREINELASLGYELLKEWVMITKGTLGLEQCIESLQDFMHVSKTSSDHKKIRDNHIFEIRHDLNERWSLFGEALLKNIFDDYSKKQYDFKHDKGTFYAKNTLGKEFNEHEY